MLSVPVILAVAALIATIISGMGKCPLWVPVLLLAVLATLQTLGR